MKKFAFLITFLGTSFFLKAQTDNKPKAAFTGIAADTSSGNSKTIQHLQVPKAELKSHEPASGAGNPKEDSPGVPALMDKKPLEQPK